MERQSGCSVPEWKDCGFSGFSIRDLWRDARFQFDDAVVWLTDLLGSRARGLHEQDPRSSLQWQTWLGTASGCSESFHIYYGKKRMLVKHLLNILVCDWLMASFFGQICAYNDFKLYCPLFSYIATLSFILHNIQNHLNSNQYFMSIIYSKAETYKSGKINPFRVIKVKYIL